MGDGETTSRAGVNRLSAIIADQHESMSAALTRMSSASAHGLPAGVVLVCDNAGKLIGIATDGDVRRALVDGLPMTASVREFMRTDPITFQEGTSYSAVLESMPDVIRKKSRYRAGIINKIVFVDAENRPTCLLDFYQLWEQQIVRHRHVVVVGLGYVGLTLGLILSEKGMKVTGVDTDPNVVKWLQDGEPHFHEAGLKSLLATQLRSGFSVAQAIPPDADVFVIAVNTPVDKDRKPDLRNLRLATEAVGAIMRPGCLIAVRSTVPVGTCRSVILPILESSSDLEGGVDFHLVFVPERTVEGRALSELLTLPQIIGGLRPGCVDIAAALFSTVTSTIVRVGSLEEAELVKLVNNGFRDLVFAFSNEMAEICSHFNLDPLRVVHAANRGYPRDQVPVPSPGVGGACLVKDPYLLSSVAREAGIGDPLSLHGRIVNERMPHQVVSWLERTLRRLGKSLAQSRISIAGMAFKGHPETSDMRNSSSLEVLNCLKGRCQGLVIHDPVVRTTELGSLGCVVASDLFELFNGADAVVILTNHRSYAEMDIAPLLGRMNRPAVLLDGWGLFDADLIRKFDGVTYQRLGYTA